MIHLQVRRRISEFMCSELAEEHHPGHDTEIMRVTRRWQFYNCPTLNYRDSILEPQSLAGSFQWQYELIKHHALARRFLSFP